MFSRFLLFLKVSAIDVYYCGKDPEKLIWLTRYVLLYYVREKNYVISKNI